nr:hypothetical protein GCM10025699_38980 [Microbacterium flavescens]
MAGGKAGTGGIITAPALQPEPADADGPNGTAFYAEHQRTTLFQHDIRRPGQQAIRIAMDNARGVFIEQVKSLIPAV